MAYCQSVRRNFKIQLTQNIKNCCRALTNIFPTFCFQMVYFSFQIVYFSFQMVYFCFQMVYFSFQMVYFAFKWYILVFKWYILLSNGIF